MKKKKKMMKDVLSPEIDFSEYVGEWVVICENQIIAHDENLTNLDKEINKCKRTPVIAKIPKEDTLIF